MDRESAEATSEAPHRAKIDVESKNDLLWPRGIPVPKPSVAARVAARAAASFWVGGQTIFIGFLAYRKLWLGEGQGTYEGGLTGFLLGTVLLGLFSTVPAAAFFLAVFILGLLRDMARGNTVRLCVCSVLIGLLASLLFIELAMSP